VLEAVETSAPANDRSRYSMHAFGAVFAEVAVDPDFDSCVQRLVGAMVPGASSILDGPQPDHQRMVGGIRMALMERTIIDRGSGRIVNANLADYLVPVNADIATLERSSSRTGSTRQSVGRQGTW
jgi:xanthine dehydrogenase YagR molybdenum-binding subunit